MITIKEWMELVDYKITEGSEYMWRCYGNHAYSLSSWNGVHGKGGYSFNIVFSTKSQRVFEVEVCDYTNDRAYRLIAENKREKHRKEALAHNVNMNEAWDDIEYIDLEVVDDFIQKALAIKEGREYSTDVSVPLDLPDDLLMFAFKAAHEQNITLNEFMNQMLRDFINQVEAGEYTKQDAQDWLAKNSLPPFPVEETEDD
jgi:hypothetical protein